MWYISNQIHSQNSAKNTNKNIAEKNSFLMERIKNVWKKMVKLVELENRLKIGTEKKELEKSTIVFEQLIIIWTAKIVYLSVTIMYTTHTFCCVISLCFVLFCFIKYWILIMLRFFEPIQIFQYYYSLQYQFYYFRFVVISQFFSFLFFLNWSFSFHSLTLNMSIVHSISLVPLFRFFFAIYFCFPKKKNCKSVSYDWNGNRHIPWC